MKTVAAIVKRHPGKHLARQANPAALPNTHTLPFFISNELRVLPSSAYSAMGPNVASAWSAEVL
jgi:hypothetical protein